MNAILRRETNRPDHDVIVIGGGPAGLSAALTLGRARRRTLVLDDGRPRNAPSPAAHGLLTRDGTAPRELLELARRELRTYASVELRSVAAVTARRDVGDFVVGLEDGTEVRGRRLLLAAGVRDELPAIDGLATHWGTSVLHCGYCHGWEVRDEPLALIARGEDAIASAATLLAWSHDLALCTDGPAGLDDEQRRRLRQHRVRVLEAPLRQILYAPPYLRLVFADGTLQDRRAIFVRTTPKIVSPLPDMLGCKRVGPGQLEVGADYRTSVPGVYAAGDIALAMKHVVTAVASGAEAAMRLNGDLAQQDFGGRWSRPLCGSVATDERGQERAPMATTGGADGRAAPVRLASTAG